MAFYLASISMNRSGRKVGGQCRSSILKPRTSKRRVFADAAEVAARAELLRKPANNIISHRPKATVTWTVRNGHRVVNVSRPVPVLQLIKARR